MNQPQNYIYMATSCIDHRRKLAPQSPAIPDSSAFSTQKTRENSRLTVTSAKNKQGEARPRIFYLYEPAAFAFFERMANGKGPVDYPMTKSDGSGWMYDTTGRPRYRDWARGIKAAIRRANQTLDEDDRISEDIVAYSVRHAVITDLLTEDGARPSGR
jgi:hypothetical protein